MVLRALLLGLAKVFLLSCLLQTQVAEVGRGGIRVFHGEKKGLDMTVWEYL